MTVNEFKPKIMIIDDEEVVLDSCTLVFAGGDYQVETASDGHRGLARIPEFQPDLVFVDLKMPGLSGFEVLEKVHALDPTIVTIVITGFATVSSAVDSMKQGAFDFLPKPFTPDELRMITKRGLERRRLILETIALRREKELLREQFAAIVSHELKSPLGAIQQLLFALSAELTETLSEEQKRRFERIQTRIDDLLNLIHTWLRVISVDIEKIKETFKPVAFADILGKALESIQPQAIRKDIEIASEVPAALRPIQGDEGTLVEALVNIIGNAVKYTRPGGKVTIRAEDKGNLLMVSVADTGIGIAQEDLPNIFNEFYRGKAGREAEQGSGLGLAVTKRIIEAHDGTIRAESEPGKGSTFTVYLPVQRK